MVKVCGQGALEAAVTSGVVSGVQNYWGSRVRYSHRTGPGTADFVRVVDTTPQRER